jgi:hypothetical protein
MVENDVFFFFLSDDDLQKKKKIHHRILANTAPIATKRVPFEPPSQTAYTATDTNTPPPTHAPVRRVDRHALRIDPHGARLGPGARADRQVVPVQLDGNVPGFGFFMVILGFLW